MADNAPLRRTVAKYIDRALLDAIAAEYEKGRILLIGTTDLDARRPVIWNIGKIAESNQPARSRWCKTSWWRQRRSRAPSRR